MGNIEAITADQCEAVWPLSVEAGWNQNVADWRFMLGAGRGFGCRGEDGKWEASSLVLPLGDKLAWISMVLVTKARRRGGVGSRLLKRCIAEVKSLRRRRRPRCDRAGPADLPAARLSRSVQDLALAFRRREGLAVGHRASPLGTIRFACSHRLRLRAERHGPASSVDASRRAGNRTPPGSPKSAGRLTGYVMGREGRAASSIGPVVADSEATGLALIAKAAASVLGPFIIDVPDAHAEIRQWLEQQGAVSPRGYMRMTLGSAPGLDDPSHLFALAGPELG